MCGIHPILGSTDNAYEQEYQSCQNVSGTEALIGTEHIYAVIVITLTETISLRDS